MINVTCLPVGWHDIVRVRGGWGCGRCPRLPARRPGAAGSNLCCQRRLLTLQTGAALVPLPWERQIHTGQYVNRLKKDGGMEYCHISLENNKSKTCYPCCKIACFTHILWPWWYFSWLNTLVVLPLIVSAILDENLVFPANKLFNFLPCCRCDSVSGCGHFQISSVSHNSAVILFAEARTSLNNQQKMCYLNHHLVALSSALNLRLFSEKRHFA